MTEQPNDNASRFALQWLDETEELDVSADEVYHSADRLWSAEQGHAFYWRLC